ncbi:phosphoribosyl-ATP pyrophosphohydrolase [Caulobacter ginsengisoli]|uniref:Phosphoribosyl-ATP pyrophosphatase n=1 Tax=Caulobacter ginsengisoli TaxID=400775 RepID=A0ABU0ITC7_9CAUL|nr:phosphoribosyl-ATP diphosphatase [Caulobacter ginsengisoli]MDQ0465263.1 phosphoribosyl-ATP pyrophosphohydrolase [Caulobacter ginsengisoli]
MSRLAEVLDRLVATLEARRGGDPARSWSARLMSDPKLAARKLGEEAIEAVIAALEDEPQALADEAADVIYHLLALLAAKGVSTDEVAAVLEEREGTSGIEEKASR